MYESHIECHTRWTHWYVFCLLCSTEWHWLVAIAIQERHDLMVKSLVDYRQPLYSFLAAIVYLHLNSMIHWCNGRWKNLIIRVNSPSIHAVQQCLWYFVKLFAIVCNIILTYKWKLAVR